MLGVLGPLSSQTKLFSSRTKPRGDSFVFRMHYRTTFVFIMGCCLLVTATQYLGDKIACLVDKDSLSQKVIDTYCFISSTYTLPSTADMEVSERVCTAGSGKMWSELGRDEVNGVRGEQLSRQVLARSSEIVKNCP